MSRLTAAEQRANWARAERRANPVFQEARSEYIQLRADGIDREVALSIAAAVYSQEHSDEIRRWENALLEKRA